MYLIDINEKMISKYAHLVAKIRNNHPNMPQLLSINVRTGEAERFTFPNDRYLNDLKEAMSYIAMHLIEHATEDGMKIVFRMKNKNEWLLGATGRHKDEC